MCCRTIILFDTSNSGSYELVLVSSLNLSTRWKGRFLFSVRLLVMLGLGQGSCTAFCCQKGGTSVGPSLLPVYVSFLASGATYLGIGKLDVTHCLVLFSRQDV